MSFYRDGHIRNYALFLTVLTLALFAAGLAAGLFWTHQAKALFLSHDEAIASALLNQGLPRDAVAAALTNTQVNNAGQSLMAAIGRTGRTDVRLLPTVSPLWRSALIAQLILAALFAFALAAGTFVFFQHRKRLYEQAADVLTGYLRGDFSHHLPRNREGLTDQVFTLAEQLATALQAQSEAEHRAKDFLKNTLSDISHQLKTPLAALAMYQQIVAAEPDNPQTVAVFAEKMDASLKRMEQLIAAMLKITRLDAGSIVFERADCPVRELIDSAVGELITRAQQEGKRIVTAGDPQARLVCDPQWTREAIGNLVKNALDHMASGGQVRITWEQTAAMTRIVVADDGSGIAPEDIHHIFKRFYRSKHALNTQGVGLGLPLAKAIVEGQNGVLSVRSAPGEGAVFTICFLTKL